MSTRTILVWQLCCEASNHTSDAPNKDTRVGEIWRTELKRRPHPSLQRLQHLHELTLNICDCRCLDDSNVERNACSGFLYRCQQSLHSSRTQYRCIAFVFIARPASLHDRPQAYRYAFRPDSSTRP